MIPKTILIPVRSANCLEPLAQACVDNVCSLHPHWEVVQIDPKLAVQGLSTSKEQNDLLMRFGSSYLMTIAYCLQTIYRTGGIMLDADVYMNSPFDDFLHYDVVYSLPEETCRGPWLLAAQALNPLIRCYIEKLTLHAERSSLATQMQDEWTSYLRGPLFLEALGCSRSVGRDLRIIPLTHTPAGTLYSSEGDSRPVAIHHELGTWQTDPRNWRRVVVRPGHS